MVQSVRRHEAENATSMFDSSNAGRNHGHRRSFFFGHTDRALYGCHHAPEGPRERDLPVVLCYPIGLEYIRSHRTFVQLASRLSRGGFHVLRFDYFGTGDSSGADEDADVAQWLSDIRSAIGEVRSLSRSSEVILVGLRFGATLAYLTATQMTGIREVLLWEPILKGADYIEELQAWQRDRSSTPEDRSIQANRTHDLNFDALGFAFSPLAAEPILRLDLSSADSVPESSLVVLERSDRKSRPEMASFLERLAGRVTYRSVPHPGVWIPERGTQAIVPVRAIDAIESQLSTWVT